jgi:hypothetical protein
LLVQNLPEQHAELLRSVEKNLAAMLLGEGEPEVRPPVAGDLQHAVGHLLHDLLSGPLRPPDQRCFGGFLFGRSARKL